MPIQNRVTPLGALVATPARGLVYGNRGCLHDENGCIRRSFAVKRWIACRLEFKGWHRAALLQPGRFTELFFLDEATAFAAGHRPCALCRREDYDRVVVRLGLRADALDERLHVERLNGSGAISPTARSCSRRASRGSCSETSCSAGPPPAIAIGSRDPPPRPS